jgi:hypothetical protein
MKGGRTHLAHKTEYAVDMETGAVASFTLKGAGLGDTATVHATVAMARLATVAADHATNM